jgi:hypothetical protein
MTDSTIVPAKDVASWVDAAKRYPLAGSDLKERFLAIALSHEQLRTVSEVRDVEIRRLNDDLSALKAALKAKGGRKR